MSTGTGTDGSRIPEAFADGPAFIPYLAAGDPDVESTKEYVRALVRGGADVVELGLPFSEPIAEGSTIQNAIVRSLEGGMTPEAYFGLVDDLDVDVPIVCMTYYNLIYRYGEEEGPEPFVRRASEVGIDGFVVPDLPAEESGPLREACDAHGLDLIFIVAPTTRGERLERIMSQVSGYVYVQARLGTTGARTDVSDQTDTSLERLREWDVPKAVGFGISEREHAERIVAGGADGIIVGSALVDVVAEGDTEEGTVSERLERKARELKEGALVGAEDRPQPERP
ncbi:tryptophan synthase subunit alpha [Halalkalicoccus salilacus]|uniref:tryptophan synthase subunit alpha n=1 Tax=Halalkalicoccus salilacus TaxID=3117459 RepID=UPI00300F451A